MKPSRKIAMAVATLSAFMLLIGIFISGHKPIMPLDELTLAKYQKANSVASSALHDAHPEMAGPVEASLSFRIAVKQMGYDPDQSLLYWLAPEFKRTLANGDPNLVVTKSRLTDSLIATALGDRGSADEFAMILTNYSPSVRKAALARRPPAP